MDDMPVKFAISAIKDTVRATWPKGRTTHSTAQVMALCHALARVREQMEPAVSTEIPRGTKLEARIDPCWQLTAEPLSEGIALSVRDPGIGWMTFAFSPGEATAMLEALQDWARQRRDTAPQRPM